MARSSLTTTVTDLQKDAGSVSWSFIQGEQAEYPITLSFIANVSAGYVFKAVVLEADNVYDDPTVPNLAKPNGVKTTLAVRVPTHKGAWAAGTAYNREDVVTYGGVDYKLSSGTARISATLPSEDPLWVVYVNNKVYIQFPSSMSVAPAWSVQPTNKAAVTGFFELSVTEPSGGIYQRVWKPVRGTVSLLYSPTAQV